MSRNALSGLALALVVAVASPAAAQTCRGLPAIGDNSKGNIGGRLSFMSQVFGVDANFAYGTSLAFGGFHYGKNNYTEFAYTSTTVGFNLGGQLGFGEDKRLSICPTFNFVDESASGLNAAALSETIDVTTGGASLGFVMKAGRQKEIIPALELSVGHLRDSLAIPSTKVTDQATIGIVTLGIGICFDRRVTLRPALTRQIGGAHPTDVTEFAAKAHTSFSLMAVFAYGRR